MSHFTATDLLPVASYHESNQQMENRCPAPCRNQLQAVSIVQEGFDPMERKKRLSSKDGRDDLATHVIGTLHK